MPCKTAGEPRVVEKIGTLHLFLSKIEHWDCRGFLLPAFETDIKEHLELRPVQGCGCTSGGLDEGGEETEALGK